MRSGIPVSPGVAVGTAYRIDEVFVNPDTKRLEPGQVQAELARYERARAKTADDLRSLKQKVARQVGPHEAAIFASHLAILEDPAFDSKTRAWIAEHHETAQAALHHLMNEYASMFARTRDEYLKLRLNDLRDVVLRISGHLSEVLQPDGKTLPGPLIVVADELLPSHVVALGDRPVMGIVTQAGGQTSHAAILARSRGIPAVSGMRGILKQVETGDRIVVDGTTGNVVVNPDSETESAYRKLQREFVDLKDQLAANRDQPALSADGETVQLLANINGIADVKAATAMGATGIGLYRTEYLYLTHPSVPDEEEQFQAYREVIAASPGNTVTIRTLDIGGDKTVPYLGHAREANPFMGWRSIRLSFEHPELFSTQIRAILRAAAAENCEGRTVRMLFPMVTTFEEMRRLRTLVDRARRQLESRRVRVGPVPVGLMLEVPAAAVSIRSLLPTVDFVSIGSNDLVQYLMAADRDNPKVSHLCQPLSPPVIRVLTDVIAACNAAHKPVTLCGEMAGSPKGFLLLFGMGLRSFSMSPAFIPSMKELLSHLTVANAESIHRRLLMFKAISQVSRYLGEQVKKLAPSLSRLDTA